MQARRVCRGVIAALIVLSTSFGARAFAQEQTGILQGRVMDTSGAALPGVTVTVSGATILGGTRSSVSSETGNYRLQNLPLGTYTVTFELAGFQTKAFSDIRVQAGTTFSLDAQLGVASVAETVTVAGESPVIEAGATDVSFNYTKELMSTIPNARDVWAMVNQAPGITSAALNVGGTNTGNQANFRAHGSDPRQNTFLLNGANVTDNTGPGGSQFYFDVDSFDEVQIEMNSHGAETQMPGIILNMVPKSGTNALRGTANVYFGTDKMQSNNVDDALRTRGVDRASNLKTYFDGGVDLGGPIMRDKLWFWGAFRRQDIERYITGTRNPDGTFPIDRTFLWYPSAKVNYQATKAHNLSTFFNMQQKKRFNSGLSALRPRETTANQQNDPISRLVTLRDDWVINSHAFLSTKFNYSKGAFRTTAVSGVDATTTPPRLEVSTGVYAGAPPGLLQSARKTISGGAALSYSIDNWLGGRHDLKTGVDLINMGAPVLNYFPADHELDFFNTQPFEVRLVAPGKTNSVAQTNSLYLQDSWQVNRATLNLGLRYDRQTSYLPEDTAPSSRFFPDPIKQQKTDNLISWNSFAPRLGIAYDLTGNSKTLLKASYSRYYWQVWASKAGQASVAGQRTLRYEWLDLNGDRQFQVNETGALRAIDDPATRPIAIDPDLKPSNTDEFTVGLAHELIPNVSVSGTYIFRNDKDLDWRINTGVTAADYTVVNGTDPGPDGVRGTSDDGSTLAFYELSNAKRTLSANFITTRPDFQQQYRGFELTVNRRLVNGWQAVGSITTGVQREAYGSNGLQLLGQDTQQLPAGLPTPQDVNFISGTRTVNSIPVIVKLMGSYQFPWHISLSGFFQHLSGNPFTRQVNAVSAVGRALNQGNVVVLAGERNKDAYDGLNLLDLRVNYDVPISRFNVGLALDLFNVMNINTVTVQNLTSGSAYGRVIGFVPPRVIRFGIKLRF